MEAGEDFFRDFHTPIFQPGETVEITIGPKEPISQYEGKGEMSDPYDESKRLACCPHCGMGGNWWNDSAPERCAGCGLLESEKSKTKTITVEITKARAYERAMAIYSVGEGHTGDYEVLQYLVAICRKNDSEMLAYRIDDKKGGGLKLIEMDWDIIQGLVDSHFEMRNQSEEAKAVKV